MLFFAYMNSVIDTTITRVGRKKVGRRRI